MPSRRTLGKTIAVLLGLVFALDTQAHFTDALTPYISNDMAVIATNFKKAYGFGNLTSTQVGGEDQGRVLTE